MSDYMRAKFVFNSDFDKQSVRLLLDAIIQATDENWKRFPNVWRFEREDIGEKFERWLAQLTSDQMLNFEDDEEQIRIEEGDNSEKLSTELEAFSFSPIASWAMCFTVAQTWLDQLKLSFSLNTSARYLEQGIPPSPDSKFIEDNFWKLNQECLFNIFDKVSSVLPLKARLIDEEFFADFH